MTTGKFVITGNPPIKKNSRSIGRNAKTGRMFPMKSPALRAAEEAAIWELQEQKSGDPWDSPVAVKFIFFRCDQRRVDLSNLYEFAQDVLQKAGILTDDFWIFSHDGSRREYDHEHPRTEITITPYED